MLPQSLIALIVGASGLLSVPKNSTIRVECASASGSISCDWKCYDSCVAPHGINMSVDTFIDCLAAINGECNIPAIAFATLTPDWVCVSSDEEIRGYGVQFPSLLQLDADIPVTKRRLTGLSVDLVGNLDRTSCRSLIEYTVSSSESVAGSSLLPETQPLGLKEDSVECTRTPNWTSPTLDGAFKAEAAFGFHLLNLNVTEWAMAVETDEQSEFGDQSRVLELATKGPCFTDVVNSAVIYLTLDITVPSHRVSGTSSAFKGSIVLLTVLVAVLSG